MSDTDIDWEEQMEEYSETGTQLSVLLERYEHLAEPTEPFSPIELTTEVIALDQMSFTRPNVHYNSQLDFIIRTENCYLHQMVYHCQVALIAEFLHSAPENLSSILEFQDHEGNTPLMLAVKLCALKREQLSIVSLLLEFTSNARKKDFNGWTPLDEAAAQKNRELVSVLFDALYCAKKDSWSSVKRSARKMLRKLPDFYLEFTWEFTSNVIPFMKKLAPSDTCKLWKSGSRLRLDSSLVGWKKLRSKRRPMSFLFDREFRIVNHARKIVTDPLEDLELEERAALLNDIMQSDPVQGTVEMKTYKLQPLKNWRGRTSTVHIGNWECTQHQLTVNANVSFRHRKLVKSECYRQESFRTFEGRMPKPVFDVREAGHSDNEQSVQHVSGPQKNKKFKANCWLCNHFPLTVRDFIGILEILSTMNKSFSKLKQFLQDEGFLALIPEDSFPVKIEVPVTLGIKGTISFKNYETIDNSLLEEHFMLPDYTQVSRIIGQKTLTCPKKRLFLANFVV